MNERPPRTRSASRTSPGIWVAAALACVALTGCSTLRQLSFEQPTVELDALQITGLDLSGATFVLWLDVYNPNGYEIRTTRIVADLDLEDTHFGSATLEESVTLDALSHTVVEIPATITWEGIGAGARALLGRGAVDYLLDARLRVETSLGGRDVRFRTRGEVPIRELGR